LNTEQGGVSCKPTEAPAYAEAEPAHRQRLGANALLLLITLRGEYEYGYSWGRPINGISLNIRGYSIIFHL